MTRKEFIESVGATCRNWRWSWSFVNEAERFVVFGAWDVHTEGNTSLILSQEWETNDAGRRQPAFAESREHLRLVEEEGYKLFTFVQEFSDERHDESGSGPSTIKGFEPVLHPKELKRVGGLWFASDGEAHQFLPEEVHAPQRYSEGAATRVFVNSYERSRKARMACVRHHGYSCIVCGFSFEEAYGQIGESYIHVHHVRPLAEVGAEYTVDPVEDLVPVCANCHAMIHRTEPALTVEQLQAHLGELRGD